MTNTDDILKAAAETLTGVSTTTDSSGAIKYWGVYGQHGYAIEAFAAAIRAKDAERIVELEETVNNLLSAIKRVELRFIHKTEMNTSFMLTPNMSMRIIADIQDIAFDDVYAAERALSNQSDWLEKHDAEVRAKALEEINGLQAAARFWTERAGQFSEELEKLRNQSSEPVAWMLVFERNGSEDRLPVLSKSETNHVMPELIKRYEPLYTAPVKPDHVLVPIEATQAQIDAMCDSDFNAEPYCKMYAAAINAAKGE